MLYDLYFDLKYHIVICYLYLGIHTHIFMSYKNQII
jgi:hypothetical protein